MWNSDTPGYTEGTDPIYQSIPFYLGWEDGQAYGLFYDNSHRSTFDLGHTGQDSAGYTAAGGVLDYYFFQGPSLKKILGRYTELTGPMRVQIKIRHRHEPAWAILESAGTDEVLATFDEPQRAITPGQSAVFYDGDEVVGGGWII